MRNKSQAELIRELYAEIAAKEEERQRRVKESSQKVLSSLAYLFGPRGLKGSPKPGKMEDG